MKNIFLLLPLVILITISCEKNDLSENNDQKEYFPNKVNTIWKYERFDSLQNMIDTLIVSIVDDTLLSWNTYTIWKYDYKTYTEKFYVLEKKDSITTYKLSFDRIDQLYIIPFELHNGWINPDYHFDTSFVSAIQDITIDNRNYSNVVLIERTAFCCNDYLIEKLWFKPYLGLLKMERLHYILGPYKNETWKLIENNIE